MPTQARPPSGLVAQVVVATFDWRGQVQNSWAFLRFLGQHTEFYEALGSSNSTSGRNISGPLCPYPYFCTLSCPSVTSSTTSNDFPLASCPRPFLGKFHHVFPSGDNPLHFREILTECLHHFQLDGHLSLFPPLSLSRISPLLNQCRIIQMNSGLNVRH